MDPHIRTELAVICKRREEALDRFVEAWRTIIALDYRADVLLDRSNDREKATP